MKRVMALGFFLFLVLLSSCKPIEVGQVIQWPGLPPVVITSPKVVGEGDIVKLWWETAEHVPIAFISGPGGIILGKMEETDWFSYSLTTKIEVKASQIRIAVESNGATQMLPVYRGKDLPKDWEVNIEKAPSSWNGWRVVMEGSNSTLNGELCKILDTGSCWLTEQTWMNATERSTLRKLSLLENEGRIWQQNIGFNTNGNAVNQVQLGWQGINLTLLGAEPLQGLFRWSQVVPDPNLPSTGPGKLLVQNLDYEVLQSDDPRIQAAPSRLPQFSLLSKEVIGDSVQLHIRWADDGTESYVLAPNPEKILDLISSPKKLKTTWGKMRK